MPDLVGCGLSDRPDASYALSWHAQIIAEWLLALGITEVDVVGHSFGGGVAQVLLLERRLSVRRLALLASGGLGREVGFWLRLAATSGVVERFGQPFMAHGTRLALRTIRCGMPAEHLIHLSEVNARPGSARAFARTVRDVIDWRGQRRMFFHRAHELDALPAVTVCWGDRDPVIPIAHGVAFVKALSGARLHRFAGAGHYLHHEQPQRVTELLSSFLFEANVARARLRPTIRPRALVPPGAVLAPGNRSSIVVRLRCELRVDRDGLRHGRAKASVFGPIRQAGRLIRAYSCGRVALATRSAYAAAQGRTRRNAALSSGAEQNAQVPFATDP